MSQAASGVLPSCLDGNSNTSSSGSPASAAPQKVPFGNSPRSAFFRKGPTPEQVLKAFSTRAFRREHPDNPALFHQVIADAMAKGEPVPFVMYWGKGLRPRLAQPEFQCLKYMASMYARIEAVYQPGATMTLVFTDTHAALNGHSAADIATYYEDLRDAAGFHGFTVLLLSEVIENTQVCVSPEELSRKPSEGLLAALRVSAAKWFKGDGTPEDGAVRYFQANMLERRVMEHAFPGNIFVTFNGSALRPMFPDTLPIFYMYSVRVGVTDKPWFLPPHGVDKPGLTPNADAPPLAPARSA